MSAKLVLNLRGLRSESQGFGITASSSGKSDMEMFDVGVRPNSVFVAFNQNRSIRSHRNHHVGKDQRRHIKSTELGLEVQVQVDVDIDYDADEQF